MVLRKFVSESLWRRSSYTVDYKKKDALMIRNALRRLVGKKVVLYGGGSMSERWVGVLRSLKVVKPDYVLKGVDVYNVSAKIFFADRVSPNQELVFSPNLGSWKIAGLEE